MNQFITNINCRWLLARQKMYYTNDDFHHKTSVVGFSGNKSSVEDLKKHKNNPKKDINNAVLLKSSLLYQTKEYFNSSTLHGVVYIVETGRPFFEK